MAIIGKEAPSDIPRLLHLVQLPRTHNSVARRIAKETQALTHPIIIIINNNIIIIIISHKEKGQGHTTKTHSTQETKHIAVQRHKGINQRQ